MTIREAINMNPKVGLALYSSQIDPTLAISCSHIGIIVALVMANTMEETYQ